MASETCKQLALRAERELLSDILPFWLEEAPDRERGGFWARVSPDLQVRERAPKGLILNARILWTFSAAYRQYLSPVYLGMARRAWHELATFFTDPIYGGMFWMLDERNLPLDDSKKIYGQAFALYSLTEYHLASGEQEPLERALAIYRLIEEHNYDSVNTGYLESASRDWSPTQDLRLSAVDMNEKKSMNTHLHLLEAYTQLFRAWPDDGLRERLVQLINNFLDHIIDAGTYHLVLFFDEHWQPKSHKISYGHDIETSWLLDEAAQALGDPVLGRKCQKISVAMANAVLEEGVAADGGLCYECEEGHTDAEVHWWVQSEAVVGFANAYQNSGRPEFLTAAVRAWDFIEAHFFDRTFGEWYYKVNAGRETDHHLHKISEWKCPYHNSRACLELVRRVKQC
ncbi:MAG TPA: AGE family epimerase/isomerase [bacterium]|mgnify:CR=1 FL=1|nr:AGE family epimerase/isomerase [bacterium]HQG44579.1 AGE family epimerase/isomerase [bacterium]HQI47025.1 AGE family epimerase/isomerase [bacterium]HQJ65736.1 AGE family epimerase/isomerase [bacterium]